MGGAARLPRPDQASPRIIVDLRVGVEEGVLEIVEGVIVQVKLPLEGAVGYSATPLKHGYRVVEDLLKGHRRPSLCR